MRVDAVRYAYLDKYRGKTVRCEKVVFNGCTFRRYPESKRIEDRRYYKPSARDKLRGAEALHREIWKSEHGPIPEGYQIHHKDGDSGNNSLLNLECVTVEQHQARHPYRAPEGHAKHLSKIRPLAAKWHRSEAGREWHSGHAKEALAKRVQNGICECCEKEFILVGCIRRGKFCSNACKAKHRRESGADDVDRLCAICGGLFRASRYSKVKCCSRECGRKSLSRTRRERFCKRVP